MGLLDVFKSEADRQRDNIEEEEEKLQAWINPVRDELLGMVQSYEDNLGRSARGEAVHTDTDRLQSDLTRHANSLERLVERSEAEEAKDEFKEELRDICEQAREVADHAQFGPKFTATPGRELKENIEPLIDQIE